MHEYNCNIDGMGLYVHVPFCQQKCGYCGFYSVPVADHDVQQIIDVMLNELTAVWPGGNAKTIYIGGGSPSCLPLTQLRQLLAGIVWHVGRAAEFTVELNPQQVTEGLLELLRRHGVNRLSIGAQSFDDAELKLLGRMHDSAAIKRAVHAARAVGFENISLDMIFALPKQRPQSWQSSLGQAIALEVQHISAYSLSYEPATPLQKALQAGQVVAVDEELDRQMYETAIGTLAQAGYQHYEISNFAKPGCQCIHNLGYWSNCPYIGIGPAAGSYFEHQRWLNIADIYKYVQAIQQQQSSAIEEIIWLSPQEIACETAVLNLRLRKGINFAQYSRSTGFDAAKLFAKAIQRQSDLGLLHLDDTGIRLTDKALPIADSVLAEFTMPDADSEKFT